MLSKDVFKYNILPFMGKEEKLDYYLKNGGNIHDFNINWSDILGAVTTTDKYKDFEFKHKDILIKLTEMLREEDYFNGYNLYKYSIPSDVNWDLVVKQTLSEKFIEEHADKLGWESISIHQTMSEEFVNNHIDKLNLDLITSQGFSDQFFEKYKDKLDWDYISRNQTLSESFIEKFDDYVDWDLILMFQTLSEEFIEELDINFWHLPEYQTLSEQFIERHSDELSWKSISKYQTLSEQFIEDHSEDVDWDLIAEYQVLSEKFILRHRDRFHFIPKTRERMDDFKDEVPLIGSNKYSIIYQCVTPQFMRNYLSNKSY